MKIEMNSSRENSVKSIEHNLQDDSMTNNKIPAGSKTMMT